MAMSVNEWVELIQRQGGMCNDYMRKLNAVTNKTEMFRVICDVNGGSWLFELHARGVQIPIDSFLKEFSNYINGKKVMTYPNDYADKKYSSKFYCRYQEENFPIKADTTLVYLLECKDAKVVVPMNHYTTLILSHGTNADIKMLDGTRLNLELYGDAKYNIEGDKSKIIVMQH